MHVKVLIDAKPLRTRFHKIDQFIRVFDESRYIVLFALAKYYSIYNRIRYLMSQKGRVTYDKML